MGVRNRWRRAKKVAERRGGSSKNWGKKTGVPKGFLKQGPGSDASPAICARKGGRLEIEKN